MTSIVSSVDDDRRISVDTLGTRGTVTIRLMRAGLYPAATSARLTAEQAVELAGVLLDRAKAAAARAAASDPPADTGDNFPVLPSPVDPRGTA